MIKLGRYYLPGLISIVGLPVLLFIWGPQDKENYNCVSVQLNEPIAAVQHKNIINLNLNDYVWNDQSAYFAERKFDFIRTAIEKLQFTHDTASVLKISFGENNRYINFARVINQALVYNITDYNLSGNDLYLFAKPAIQPRYSSVDISEQINMLPGVNSVLNAEGLKGNWKTRWHSFTSNVQSLFYHQQQNKYLAIGFLLLIVLPTCIRIRNYFLKQPLTFSFS